MRRIIITQISLVYEEEHPRYSLRVGQLSRRIPINDSLAHDIMTLKYEGAVREKDHAEFKLEQLQKHLEQVTHGTGILIPQDSE